MIKEGPLKVYYFYSADWPEACDLVIRHAPMAEHVWTGGHPYEYWQATTFRWGQDDLVTIEQDIGIHAEVIPQFENCPEPWCAFGYQIGTSLCYTGGGCRKLSLEAQQQVPLPALMYPVRDIGECPVCAALCWRHMDTRITAALEDAGFRVHVHEPQVRHLRMELALRHGDEEAGTAHRLASGNAQGGQVQVGTGKTNGPCCDHRGIIGSQ
jgi:hypothetical protein